MWHTLSSFVRRYSFFLVLFLLFLAVFIFSGFFLHIYINHWTLVVAFVTYIVFWGVYLAISHGTREKFLSLALYALITPIVFWGGTALFGHTYDTSFDGQSYHETAVIALADKWNPVYDSTFPITTPQSATTALDQGNPKIAWSIDASIYKLTHSIDSATVINLFIGLIALVFAWDGLRTIGLRPKWALVVSLLTICNTLFIEQLFSFREDSLSYDFLIIGIAAMIALIKGRDKLVYLICLLTSFIFLAGTKYSNLYIFLALGCVAAYVIVSQKIYQLKIFKFVALAGLVCALVTLSNPYITNTTRYHAVDYPYNEKVIASTLKTTGVPINIRTDSKLELFYYGIFSTAEISNAQGPSSYARLKAPFTFTKLDLTTEASVTSKLVGGYGVLFSGIFVVSCIAYVYLLLIKKSKKDNVAFTWLSVALGLILLSCLLTPIPNYARYNGQLGLMPIAIATMLLIMGRRSRGLGKILAVFLITAVALNIYLDAVPTYLFGQSDFNAINAQLSSLQHSDKTYLVNAHTFYPDYLKLESHGIKIEISASPVTCKQPITLYFSAATELCPL
jgi:hypothetical protein